MLIRGDPAAVLAFTARLLRRLAVEELGDPARKPEAAGARVFMNE
jgi:hypothetical protein